MKANINFIGLVMLSRLSTFVGTRNRDRLEFYLWRFHFKSFLRHPEVSDNFTNHSIGYGHGMARTSREVLTFFKIIRIIHKRRKIKVGIDLGCGDGVVLKYFSMAGLNAVGIEYDQELPKLASLNNPKARVITGDLTDKYQIKKCLEAVCELEPTLKDRPDLVVYAFNPMVPEILIDVIKEVSEQTEFVLFLKNPTLRGELQKTPSLELKRIYDDGNHLVLEVKKLREKLSS